MVNLPQQRPFGYRKTYDSFVIPIHMTTYAERLTKIGLVIAEIFYWTGRFCRLVQKRAIVTLAISGVTGPTVTKIVLQCREIHSA